MKIKSFFIDVVLDVVVVVALTCFDCLDGKGRSALSSIRLFSCVVFQRSFTLHTFGCSFLCRSFSLLVFRQIPRIRTPLLIF